MHRSYQVFERVTGKRLYKLYYGSEPQELLKVIKKKQDKGEVYLSCSCANHIEMKVSNRIPYYVYPAKRQPHGDDCIRNTHYVPKAQYERGWKREEQNGSYRVKMEPAPVPPKKKGTFPVEVPNRLVYRMGEGNQPEQVTMFGFITKLNMMAWERLALNKKNQVEESPSEVKMEWKVARMVWKVAESIYINENKEPLQRMFYRGSHFHLQPQKDVVFLYGTYKTHTHITYGKQTRLLVTIEDGFGKSHSVYVHEETFEQKWKREQKHSHRMVIAGFAHKEAKNYHYLSLFHYDLFSVSDNGLYVENAYQKQVYEALFSQGRIFTKAYESPDGYGEFIPAFVLIDQEREVIGEIFETGVSLEEEKEQQKKVTFSRLPAFREGYDFWVWDVSLTSSFLLPL